MMTLITDQQRARLLCNGMFNTARRARGEDELDFMPVVKLFAPWSGATWLLSELDPEDTDIAFGLCDLGVGFPELGNASLSEIESVTGPGGLRIERDLGFKARKTLSAYAEEARLHQRIVT
jgi:hypothetical protein